MISVWQYVWTVLIIAVVAMRHLYPAEKNLLPE